MAIGVIGFALVCWKAGWIAALGMLIAMWGNNLERRAETVGDERGS
jgi:hypothetical protein